MFGNIRLYQVGINGCMSVNKLLTFINAMACTVIIKDISIIPLRIHYCIWSNTSVCPLHVLIQ